MEEVVEYKYDTWGRVVGMEGSAYGQWVGSLNPFRYRGYYYDDESGMYYLTTRYYNPEWCRFLNADSTLIGNVGASLHNLYAYAANNPVVYSDPSGMGVYYSPGCKTQYDPFLGLSINTDTKTGTKSYYSQPSAKPHLSADDYNIYETGKGEPVFGLINIEFNPKNIQVIDGKEIPNPNIRIYDSWRIRNFPTMLKILETIMSHPYFDPDVYTRDAMSYFIEWDAHNLAYDLYVALDNKEKIESTQHVDLDNNENRGFGFTIVFIGDAMTYRPWFR